MNILSTGHKWKIRIIAAVMLAAIVLLTGLFLRHQGQVIDDLKAKLDDYENTPVVVLPAAPEVSLDVINTTLQEIGELATTEYLYTDAGRYSDAREVGNFTIPFTKKHFTMKWDGVIKAGIEVDEINVELNQKEKILTVHLPQAKILSHEIDEDSIEVLDESDGLFNSVSVEDQVKFNAACKGEMEQRAIENGLLEKAQKNAQALILQLLNANPDLNGNYQIECHVSFD